MNVYIKPNLELFLADNSDIITESVPITETTITDDNSGGIWSDLTDDGAQ